MNDELISNTREGLQFQRFVAVDFGYLVRDLGFQLIGSDPYCVYFRSQGVFVKVLHNAASYEVQVVFGRVDYPSDLGRPFTLRTLAATKGAEAGLAWTQPWADDAVKLRAVVSEAAKDLLASRAALIADEGAYARLAEARRILDCEVLRVRHVRDGGHRD